MKNFRDFDLSGIEVEISTPPQDRIVSGTPQFHTWNIEESADGKLFAGVWESTPGKWRVEYDEWEFCHILSGRSILTDETGHSREVFAGDSFTIQPRFKGYWEVLETTRKEYVIRLG